MNNVIRKFKNLTKCLFESIKLIPTRVRQINAKSRNESRSAKLIFKCVKWIHTSMEINIQTREINMQKHRRRKDPQNQLKAKFAKLLCVCKFTVNIQSHKN